MENSGTNLKRVHQDKP